MPLQLKCVCRVQCMHGFVPRIIAGSKSDVTAGPMRRRTGDGKLISEYSLKAWVCSPV